MDSLFGPDMEFFRSLVEMEDLLKAETTEGEDSVNTDAFGLDTFFDFDSSFDLPDEKK